jgi:hypothetical protein
LLEPFDLNECETFLASRGHVLTRQQVLDAHMIVGGVPYYLDQFDRSLSVAQNVDALCFGRTGALTDEYESLFASLFARPEAYLAVVEALATTRSGLGRDDLVRTARVPDGGGLTRVLDDLDQCGFIRKYRSFGKVAKNALFQLIDPFTLFHLTYLRRGTSDEHYWSNNLYTGAFNAWRGYAFELTCLLHVDQIKRRLGILGVSTSTASWRSREAHPGTQIDLVIDRRDGVVNLCEMKYAPRPYTVTGVYANHLDQRRAIFAAETGTTSALHTTLVTPYGLAGAGAVSAVQSVVTLDDLFAPRSA